MLGRNIKESRSVQPNKKYFTAQRIIGSGDLRVTEFVLTYDAIPSYAVSILEVREGVVARLGPIPFRLSRPAVREAQDVHSRTAKP